MKGKYITLQVMLACLSRPVSAVDQIHAETQKGIKDECNELECLVIQENTNEIQEA